MRYALLSACFLLAWVFVNSCSSYPKKMNRAGLISYINEKDHGLVQEQEINGVRVKMNYQPSGLLAAQEIGEGRQVAQTMIDSIEKKYSKNYYFLVKFSKDGKEAIRQLGSFSRYSDMVQVMSFQMHQFINLTTPQKDTIPLADYLFDQTYGMSDGNTILLCFDKQKLSDKKKFEINVGECGFGTGNLKFPFEQKDIQKAPELDYRSPNNNKAN